MTSLGRYERSTNIWPGFVDALATLLMVIIFLLLIFVLAQFFLSQALSGRDSALQRLETQVSELADLLSLEKRANNNLTENLAQLSEQLQSSVADRDNLNATVSVLRATLGENQAKIDKMVSQIHSDKEELQRQNLEIASLSQDVDALRALRAELETQVSNLATRAAMLRDVINNERGVRTRTEQKLSKTVDLLDATTDSLSNMKRKFADAKDTISITIKELEALKRVQTKTKEELEASKSAHQSTLSELETSRQIVGKSQSALDVVRKTLLAEKDLSKSARAQIALLNQQMSALRRQLANLEQALEVSEKLSKEQKTQIFNLGKRLNAALASKLQELSRYRSEFFGQLRDVLGRQKGVRIVGDRFVFQSEVLFDKGSAEIGKPGQAQLIALAATLRNIADKIPKGIDWVLRVDGHTDSDPINTVRFPSNWELSSARAIAVVQSLITNGLPPNRLVAAGFGKFQPIDQKTDEIAKRRNRRIELKLTQR